MTNFVKGLSVRKDRFMIVMNTWSEFANQVRTKFWKSYAHNVYWALSQRKMVDIMDYMYRSDFTQVLSLQEKKKSENFYRENVRLLFYIMMKENKFEALNDQ